MKLSIITTITNPIARQDPWLESLQCYADLADEVVVVDGSAKPDIYVSEGSFKGKIKYVHIAWPENWSLEEITKHFNAGIEHATGDWVLNLDIDRLIHEDDFAKVRQTLEQSSDKAAARFTKISIFPGQKYMQKADVVCALNKNYKSKEGVIRYGYTGDKSTDLCDFVFIKDVFKINSYSMPIGPLIPDDIIARTGINFYNFDYTFKTKEVVKREFWRFARAYGRFFDNYKYGKNADEAYNYFMDMWQGRLQRDHQSIRNIKLPKYIKQTYANLTPEQFGYNAFETL